MEGKADHKQALLKSHAF
jgi:hypothetical protein